LMHNDYLMGEQSVGKPVRLRTLVVRLETAIPLHWFVER
jgi:hypothetical protein